MVNLLSQLNKSECVKKYFLTCAPSEDLDQTAHLRSLIRVFTGRSVDSQGCNVVQTDSEESESTADPQSDMNNCWAHML